MNHISLQRVAVFVLACGVVIWAGLYVNFYPRVNPDDAAAVALEERGDEYFRDGEPEKALTHWRRSLELAPERAGPYEKMSSYLIVAGRWQEAGALLAEGLTYLPGYANLYFNFGLSAYLAGEYGLAEEKLLKVSQLDSFYPDVFYLLGMIQRARGDEEEAKRFFIREVNLNPSSRRAWREIRNMGESTQ